MAKFKHRIKKSFNKLIKNVSTSVDIAKIISWKLTKTEVIVINQVFGLGDYLWVRNFSELIKQQTNYKIIACVTNRWLDFTKKMDSKFVDVFVDFSDPTNPKTKMLFKLFHFDLYIDAIGNYPVDKQIRFKDYIYHHLAEKYVFVMMRQKELFNKVVTIPSNFKYSLSPIIPKKRSGG